MKQILIVGPNSYIGRSLQVYLKQAIYNDTVNISTISVRDEGWKHHNMSAYDAIVYLAALVHQKELPKMSSEYFRVNCDLPVKLATKARKEGVSQFIFLSTMAVYGLNGNVKNVVTIDSHTPCQPTSLYGKSKLTAETLLKDLQTDAFSIAILRPPMVYGPDCPGNYRRLRMAALRFHTFPAFENKRSMIYIDNLCECIRLILIRGYNGIIHPQNNEYISSLELVNLICNYHKAPLYKSKLLAILCEILAPFTDTISKVLGNLVYATELSDIDGGNYQIVDFKLSVQLTEAASE